jgi:hypothetical protein
VIAEREPLRQRRDLGQIIDAAFRLYRQNFAVLFTIAMLVIPLGIASGIFQTIGNETAATAVIGLLTLCQAGVNLLAAAAIIVALDEIDAGQTPEFGRSYDVAFARFGALLMGVLRMAFHVVLFTITIIGIPWAIQRVIRWLFIEQTIMLEGAGPKESLSQSADVVLGSWWRTAGIWLVISILAAIPVALVRVGLFFAPVAVSSTAAAAFDALVLPFVVIAMTMLYFDLKLRKDGAAALPQPPVQPEKEIA